MGASRCSRVSNPSPSGGRACGPRVDSGLRGDVLVPSEEVVRVIHRLDGPEALVVLPVRLPDAVDLVVAEIVDVDRCLDMGRAVRRALPIFG